MDITKLAALARIKVSPGEADNLSKEFDAILEYVNQIKSVEIKDDFEEMNSGDLLNVMRDDNEGNPSGAMTENLLALSPDRDEDFIKVKKIL
jgi:aspartyl/glutamyl-tRNA(Asn/Gln) amidotransferase C subunit